MEKLKAQLFEWLDDVEAKIPEKNKDFIPWWHGFSSKEDVQLPFDMEKYDADVYYGLNMDRFH